MSQFSIINIDGLFSTFEEARDAWIAAGRPTSTGSSVWVTETIDGETVRTITLAPAIRWIRS